MAEIKPGSIAHKLHIFGYHVNRLTLAKPGEKFGLSFWGTPKSLYVEVEVSPAPEGWNEEDWKGFTFTVNGERRSPGNVYGAINLYAELCAPGMADEVQDVKHPPAEKKE